MFDDIWNWWLALPVFAASIVAAGIIWTKAIKPVVQGVNILIEYAEFLQVEVSGDAGSLRSDIKSVQSQIIVVLEQVDSSKGQISSVAVQVESLADKVDAMDTVWSKWVFSHANEHSEIWRILAMLGYDRRHLSQFPEKGAKQ